MERLFGVVLLILVFITISIIPNCAFAETQKFEVSITWEHSGRGWDRFVFQSGRVDVGPWERSFEVMIDDLTPIEVDGKNRWEAKIILETDNPDEIKWWVCYAANDSDAKSNVSEPARSIFAPNDPRSLKKVKTIFDIRKVFVTFI